MGVTKGLVKSGSLLPVMGFHLVVRDPDILKMQKISVKPLSVRILLGIMLLYLGIRYYPFLSGIHKEHTPGLKS